MRIPTESRMGLFRRKQQPRFQTEQEAREHSLRLRPRWAVQWESDADGNVVLLKPKIQNQWLAKHLAPRLRNPVYRVHLDAVGSEVWKQCDGSRTVAEIVEHMKATFGEDVEPVFERLTLFLAQLYRGRFIQYV